jgi:hypothetical protein
LKQSRHGILPSFVGYFDNSAVEITCELTQVTPKPHQILDCVKTVLIPKNKHQSEGVKTTVVDKINQ